MTERKISLSRKCCSFRVSAQQVFFLWACKLLPHLETWCTWVLLTTVNNFSSCRAKKKDLALRNLIPPCLLQGFWGSFTQKKRKKIIYKSHLVIIVLLAATHGRQKIPLNKPFLTFLIPLDKQNYLQHLNMYFHIHTLTRWTSIKMRWESF